MPLFRPHIAIVGVIHAPVRCDQLYKWMQSSGWLEEDYGERTAASYGQFMAMVLAAIPLISFLESFARKSPFLLFKIITT